MMMKYKTFLTQLCFHFLLMKIRQFSTKALTYFLTINCTGKSKATSKSIIKPSPLWYWVLFLQAAAVFLTCLISLDSSPLSFSRFRLRQDFLKKSDGKEIDQTQKKNVIKFWYHQALTWVLSLFSISTPLRPTWHVLVNLVALLSFSRQSSVGSWSSLIGMQSSLN